MIDAAIGEGYNVIVLPGYFFGQAIIETAPKYPEVKFISFDMELNDILEAAVLHKMIIKILFKNFL